MRSARGCCTVEAASHVQLRQSGPFLPQHLGEAVFSRDELWALVQRVQQGCRQPQARSFDLLLQGLW